MDADPLLDEGLARSSCPAGRRSARSRWTRTAARVPARLPLATAGCASPTPSAATIQDRPRYDRSIGVRMTGAETPVTLAAQGEAQRRILRVLVVSQILGGAGLAAGVTVGALLAEDMLGSTRVAGLPAALFTLGSAAAAFLVGSLSQRAGRRAGLAAGYAVGAVGGAGIVMAAIIGSVPLLLLGLVLYGSGTATRLRDNQVSG